MLRYWGEKQDKGSNMHKRPISFFKRHPFLTFLAMFVAALFFGLSSYNLFYLIHQNLSLITQHGVMALMDGAFAQLLQLVANGFIALLSYVLFKIGEKILVEHFAK